MNSLKYIRLFFILGITFFLFFSFIAECYIFDALNQDSGKDNQILWWFPLNAPSFGSSAVADIDKDGILEIVFGTYFNDEHIYALNAEDGSLLWSYDTGGCNDASPVIADVDLDGNLEVVIPASSPSIVYCFNGSTGEVKWSRSTGISNCIDSPPAVADVDNDEQPEIILGTFHGNVFCLNGEDGTICWQKNLGTSSYIQSDPAVLDLNNDGQLDVVVAQWAGDCRVYALWGNNGSILWYSDLPQDYMYHGCSFADIDRDNKPELIIGCYDNHVYVFNGEDGSLAWKYTTPFYVGAPTSIGDLNNDGYFEIVFVSYNILGVLSHTGTLLWSVSTGGNIFRGAAISDMNQDGILDVIFGSDDGILRVLKGDDGQEICSFDLQAHYGLVFHMDHAPVIADFNNDGILDIFIVGGYGSSDPPTNNHGRAYAVTFGNGSGPGWPMFRHDCFHSGCYSPFSNQPPMMDNITGPLYGKPGVDYTFCIQATDPNNDTIFCLWNWDDSSNNTWIGPFSSGDKICVTHMWLNEGIYRIRVKLKDKYGEESEWLEGFLICIDGTSPDVELLKPQQDSLYIFNKWIKSWPVTTIFGKITLEVEVFDNMSGMSYVHFYIDNNLKANITTQPYEWIWEKRVFFLHTIQVTAFDIAGNNASKQLLVLKFF